MANIKVEKNYAMWFDDFIEVKGKITEACIYIGLTEDEEGFDFDYTFVPVEKDGDQIVLDFVGSSSYKFIGKKTFDNPILNKRYFLGTYEFTEPDETTRFNYMMLSRLQSDCEYVVGHMSNFCKRQLEESTICNHLWGETIEHHFSEMYRLYDNFSDEEKPEWFTREQIDSYKQKIKKLVIEN